MLTVTQNRTTFLSLSQNVTTAGTPVQLPNRPIPGGMSVLIKAKNTNTGRIKIGPDTSNLNFTLGSNESISIRVTNLNRIWIDSTVNGEGIEILSET